ncbi:MAG: hypothetical protein WCK34_03245 [Bacteroidota bacterium]
MKTFLYKTITLILVFVSPAMAFGQAENLVGQIEKSVESLEIENDYEDLFEDLDDLARHPVKLNSVTGEDDLAVIPFLTPQQRKSLFDYRIAYGEVLSIYELRSITGFDSMLVRKIEPYISLVLPSQRHPFTFRNLARYGHHELLLRCKQSFPEPAGYHTGDSLDGARPAPYYLGNPQHYYFRYSFSWSDNLSLGLAGDKDPGEQFFMGSQQQGMDFYSGYMEISNIGILKSIIIGNFRASYGQGLTLGTGFSLGSVPGISANTPAARGIRPSLGMNEGSCLQGIGATIKVKPFEFSTFISYHPRDAVVSVADSLSGRAREISSFITTGYHRTLKELAGKNAAKELLLGGNLAFTAAPTPQLGFKAGLTGMYVHWSATLSPGDYPYNHYSFRGNENFSLGLDYQVRYRRLYFFGEVSRSKNSGLALLAGAVLTPDSRVAVSAIYRIYQPAYQNQFSNAFGQNSMNSNEHGIYIAINASLHPKLTACGYIYLFTFPWLKYRVDAPASGREAGALLTWQAARKVTLDLRVSGKTTLVNGATEQGVSLHKITPQLSDSYKCSITWSPDDKLEFKTMIGVKHSGKSVKDGPAGCLVCQDIKVNPGKRLENATFRFALFDIPGYDERIYSCEPEVLYGYSLPAYLGRGLRGVLVLKFNIGGKFDLWLRGGVTKYDGVHEVGTGADLTKGDTRGEFSGQVMMRL